MAFGGPSHLPTRPLPNTYGEYGAAPAGTGALMENMKAASTQAELSFIDSLLGLFGKDYPEGTSTELITKAMIDWKSYWLFPAGMAA